MLVYCTVHQRKSVANCGACVESTVMTEDTTEIEVVENTDQPSMSNASGKKSSQTRRAFDCEFTLRAVKDYYQDGENIARTARKFEIDHKQVRLWVQKEKKITQQKSRSKADGRGCSARYPLLEDRLYKEFLDLRKRRTKSQNMVVQHTSKTTDE